MTDLDRASLDRILPATSGSADWNDVRRRSGAHQRRRRLVVVLATVAIVGVGAASAFATRALFLDKGFIGLPPVGATPSAPESGKLVVHYFGPAQAGGGPKINIWVYADGRRISLGGEAVPESANALSTGFLEQHLTPEGVELLRREILSIKGEFGNEPPPAAPPPPCAEGQSSGDGSCAPPTAPPPPDQAIEVPFYTFVEVAGVGRLERVARADDLDRLMERIANPASWLPASAWADTETRAYVASKYAICYSGWPPDEPMERSRVLAMFPGAVRDRLSSAAFREGPPFGSPGHFRPSSEYCFDASTDGARELVVALDAAGLDRQGASRLNYRLEGKGDEEATIYFEPYLPHGEFTCSACG
jgi:hypothetical protein